MILEQNVYPSTNAIKAENETVTGGIRQKQFVMKLVWGFDGISAILIMFSTIGGRGWHEGENRLSVVTIGVAHEYGRTFFALSHLVFCVLPPRWPFLTCTGNLSLLRF